MGIPFYFKSLISRFPEIIKRPLGKCSHLYLDYNCIIHTCAAKAQKSITESTTPIEFQQRVIHDSLKYIDTIVAQAQPSDVLYIAVDGTCPRAKMQQQRKRRFMSVWRAEAIKQYGGQQHHNALWDSNIVTPGTDFMDRFDRALDDYVKFQRAPYRIIADGSNNFGEGEHKIYDYIDTDTNSQDIVIYGLDADLIMLSLIRTAKNKRIRLLREQPEFNVSTPLKTQTQNPNPFLELDVNLLNAILVRECLDDDPNRINDYVMLCALVGNDFIPPLSYLKIKNEGIDIIINKYKSLTIGEQLTYLVDSQTNTLNTNLLRELFRKLADVEDDNMRDANNLYYNKKCYQDPKSPAEYRVDNYPSQYKFPKGLVEVEKPNWRLSYYKFMFQDTDHITHKACTNFMEGILWVFNYYFTRTHNLGWYYKYSYSPTCLDLYNFMTSLETDEFINRAVSNNDDSHKSFVEKFNSSKHLQLLMVLPPSSVAFIPSHLQSIVTEISKGCVHYYPKSFSITLYLKTYLWECTPIIPDINLEHVYCALRSIEK